MIHTWLVVCHDASAILDCNGAKDDEVHAVQARTWKFGSYDLINCLWCLFRECRNKSFCAWRPGLRRLAPSENETINQAHAGGIVFCPIWGMEGFFNEDVQDLRDVEFVSLMNINQNKPDPKMRLRIPPEVFQLCGTRVW